MASAPKQKNHHYVPRLILRKFSIDGRRINLIVLSSGKRVDGASLGDQCCKANFYGFQDGLEKAFGKVEEDFAQVLGDLSPEHLEGLADPDILQVVLYAGFQQSRTLAAATDISTFGDKFARRILARPAQAHGIDLDLVRIETRNPQQLSLGLAFSMTPLLLDLNAKFLISDKRLGFVISDDPVVPYNQWIEHHAHLRRWPGGTGLALKGLQLFLPVSPRVSLCVYDPSTYQCGSPKQRTCRLGLRDIQRLNDLQAIHAHECLYFDGGLTPPEELDRLRRQREKHLGWREPSFIEGRLVRHDGKSSRLLGSSPGTIRLGIKFGFMRVTETNSYEGYNLGALPVRSLELVNLAQQGKSIFDKDFDLENALGLGGAANPANGSELPTTPNRDSQNAPAATSPLGRGTKKWRCTSSS